MISEAQLVRWRPLRSSALIVLIAAAAAWLLAGWIVAGSMRYLIFSAVLVSAVLIFFAIMQDWRRGLYLIVVWMVFEDLLRKFLGNATLLFFVKDAIAAMMYLSMFSAWHRRALPAFRPKFLKWFVLFMALGFIQIFNPHSPSILYGPLGFKLYFFYFPMMFAGYAYLQSEADLQRFFKLNLWIAIIVAGLGIAQSILGLSFLNPAELAPELRNLGNLVRQSPLTHMAVPRPTSVFVSDGRFAQFVTLMYLLGFGALGYSLLRKQTKRVLVLAAMATITVAIVMTGSRSAIMALVGNTSVMAAGSLWAMSAGVRRNLRLGRALRRVAMVGGAAILLTALIFPAETRARWAFYTETLSPQSSASEFGYRAIDYPLANAMQIFSQPNWVFGNGLGVASLGVQYVSKLLGQPRPELGSESGIGQLIIELGIVAPFLWLLWTCALLYEAWKLLAKIRYSHLFPVGLGMYWFLVYTLLISVFYSIITYENYLMNIYSWLFVGMLFRLPALAGERNAGTVHAAYQK